VIDTTAVLIFTFYWFSPWCMECCKYFCIRNSNSEKFYTYRCFFASSICYLLVYAWTYQC